jgi:hypothetical protein
LTHFSVIRACHAFDKFKDVEEIMRAILTIVITAFVLSSSPAAAAQQLIHNAAFAAKPQAVAVISVARQRIEMLAVTRRCGARMFMKQRPWAKSCRVIRNPLFSASIFASIFNQSDAYRASSNLTARGSPTR